jgi:adenosylcobalamin-dependent ribonucleoside-triphosphate reductase
LSKSNLSGKIFFSKKNKNKEIEMQQQKTPAKKYAKGMGKAVADRTVNRRLFKEFKRKTWIKLNIGASPANDEVDREVKEWAKENDYEVEKYLITGSTITQQEPRMFTKHVKVLVKGKWETEEWEDVAARVAKGNALLSRSSPEVSGEYETLNHHLRQASMILSGRHLQHGDETQPERNQEIFTNCSTAACSFISFYLLLNGSGVGRCYDDDMMIIDWDNMPTVVCVIDRNHKDVLSGEINALTSANAKHLYAHKKIHTFVVPDSREGWAKAVEKLEVMAFEGVYGKDVLLLDFSDVRARGSFIRGMQNRPASGPGPLINAFSNVARIKGAGMARWRQALYIDHYLAECVLVGGARRAARMSTKHWTDANILEFINVKRGGFLWSSNNSVTVDETFWRLVRGSFKDNERGDEEAWNLSEHAQTVFHGISYAAYHDGTGEPGIINQHRLTHNNEGLEIYKETGEFIGSKKYQLEEATKQLTKQLASAMLAKPYNMITNPCGEITLNILGGYCVIGDVVPYHAKDDNDAEDAVRTTVRALIRTNVMDCLYRPEVTRTNRIGVGLTGIHEYAWKRFGYGWKEIVDEERSKDFWRMLSRFKRAVVDEAQTYSKELGVTTPHTNTTIKPSGTVSKMFGLTEGAHLPAMREYLRWVQMSVHDPLVKQYEELGYQVKRLQVQAGTTIVGFPTRPEICKLGMGDKLVTAAEATPEEQFQYLMLLEKYWIKGVDREGNALPETGNQVSYTLKYDPKVVSYDLFKETLLKYQPLVRCCSVMPQTNVEEYAYEYLPEQPVTKHEYEQIMQAIKDDEIKEDVDFAHIDCSTGACPIDFNKPTLSSHATV